MSSKIIKPHEIFKISYEMTNGNKSYVFKSFEINESISITSYTDFVHVISILDCFFANKLEVQKEHIVRSLSFRVTSRDSIIYLCLSDLNSEFSYFFSKVESKKILTLLHKINSRFDVFESLRIENGKRQL